ncbi:hypothetical protein AGLY_007510 [Aphis glycines]|uniref:Galactosyltransferase C-terminal domain-containing protein n=1 Tax=Aphis glycines TaxID=307491 RepID=A0A6G0TMA4_APHGL|nr:hypothetical protein AGLY_007510 [Aphis glycines]
MKIISEFDKVSFTRLLPYHKLVGGVFNIRPDHYLLVNGYSNLFWGWGGEDDDMGYSYQHLIDISKNLSIQNSSSLWVEFVVNNYILEQVGLPITRPPERLARYTMVKHVKRKPLAHAVRLKLVHTSQKRYRADGLNTLKYEVFRVDTEKLYTRILVGVGDMPEYVRSFEVSRRSTSSQNKRWK